MTPILALSILGWATLAAGVLIALAALWHLLPRRGQPRRTLVQLVIRALYRWSLWWSCVAVAVDRGYMAYRMEQRVAVIAPENEALDTTDSDNQVK